MCIMYWEIGENRVLVKIHKNTFFVLYLLISPTKSTFSLGKNFGGTRHPCETNESTLERFLGGLHGKACRLIAYNFVSKLVHCMSSIQLAHNSCKI